MYDIKSHNPIIIRDIVRSMEMYLIDCKNQQDVFIKNYIKLIEHQKYSENDKVLQEIASDLLKVGIDIWVIKNLTGIDMNFID